MISNFINHIFVSKQEIKSDKRKILWLLNLRAIFLFSQAFIIFPFLIYKSINLSNKPLFLGLIFLAAVFNFIMYGILKNIKNSQVSLFLKLNFIFDLIITSLVLGILQKTIHLSVDGIYYIFLFLSIFLFQNKENHLFSSFVAFSYLIQKMYFYNIYQSTNVEFEIVELVSFFVCWIIVYNINMIMKNKESQLSSLAMQAEKIDRLKSLGALSSGFSHEFASPLNSLKLSFDRITRKYPIDGQEIKNIELAFVKCKKVIQDINSSFLSSGEDAEAIVELNEMIQQSINTSKGESNVKVHNLIENTNYYRLPKLNFIQILINIIENAKQATNDVEINISLQKNEEGDILTISDNGPGFSKFILEHFGEPFLTTKKLGTGLGLYTLKIFSTSIGGNVKIFNLDSGGACVQLEIPSKRVVHAA